MTLPGFTAEVAAVPAGQSYGFGSMVLALAPAVTAAAFGPLRFPVIRCCRRAPLLGNRFVCTQVYKLPWQTCNCVATLSGPVFICKDNGLGSFEPA
jgi:hypothetical protein